MEILHRTDEQKAQDRRDALEVVVATLIAWGMFLLAMIILFSVWDYEVPQPNKSCFYDDFHRYEECPK